MKIRVHAIWRVLPVPIMVVQRLPGRIVGVCMGPFVLLRADYADDWPTVVHELEHCKQFWRGGAIVHLYRYLACPNYRLRSEIEAYQAELAVCPPAERSRRLYDSARALAHGYGLAVDVGLCQRLLLAG